MKSFIGSNMIRNRKIDETVYIYKLLDPSTSIVGYVGQTNNPSRRLTMHITEARQNKFQNARGAWLAELLSRGIKPLLVIMQEATAQTADRYERFWIFHLLSKGCPLTNDVHRLTEDSIPRRSSLPATVDAIQAGLL